jgi:hypothetical protein
LPKTREDGNLNSQPALVLRVDPFAASFARRIAGLGSGGMTRKHHSIGGRRRLLLGTLALVASGSVADADPRALTPYDWLAETLPGGWSAPDHLVLHSPGELSSWRFGLYGGALNSDYLHNLEFAPWHSAGMFLPAYLVAADATYSVLEFPYVPAGLDLDLIAAAHFGGQQYGEFVVVPGLRWKWFPWNNYVYTNFRIGPIGASYDTSISRLEASESKGGRTSQFLSALEEEVTFAPSANSAWEVFVRIHHRSGMYGRIDGVDGGTNYVTAGWRTAL